MFSFLLYSKYPSFCISSSSIKLQSFARILFRTNFHKYPSVNVWLTPGHVTVSRERLKFTNSDSTVGPETVPHRKFPPHHRHLNSKVSFLPLYCGHLETTFQVKWRMVPDYVYSLKERPRAGLSKP